MNNTLSTVIRRFLERGQVRQSMADYIVSHHLSDYRVCFQHQSLFPETNYEHLEFIGDSVLQTCVVTHLAKRFPVLLAENAVCILTRLKIQHVEKSRLCQYGETCGFWDFIQADEVTRSSLKRALLEDVLEATLGQTYLLFNAISAGSGMIVCQNIIDSFLTNEPISLKYEDLYDPITRLKEFKDYYSGRTPDRPKIEIKEDRSREELPDASSLPMSHPARMRELDPTKPLYGMHIVRMNWRNPATNALSSSEGRAYKLADAQKICAQYVLDNLHKAGYKKPLTEIYARLAAAGY